MISTLMNGLCEVIRFGHLKIVRGAASDGSPTLRAATLPPCGVASLQNMPQEDLLPIRLQEKPPEFEMFLHEIGITVQCID